MLEKIYDTYKGILYNELPKDVNGKVVIYDKPIQNWFVGDREIKPGVVSVTFKNGSTVIKDISLGLQENTHTFDIEISVGASNVDNSEKLAQEASRIFLAALKKHRRVWVVDICPICEKFTLSPSHYLISHDTIFNPVAIGVTTDYETLWYQTHPASIPPTALPTSGVATESFYRVWDLVAEGTAVANLSSTAVKNIQRMQSDFVDPIRILYDVTYTTVKPSNDKVEQLYRVATISFNCKELSRQVVYGPDNVSTDAVR